MRGLYIAQQCINSIRKDSKQLLQNEMAKEFDRLKKQIHKERKNFGRKIGVDIDEEEEMFEQQVEELKENADVVTVSDINLQENV